ncbi:hypothetical protein CEXT_195261 [Caerostris extrusa]|uniref:Uncharacterized protein n=1 Tax=Caerostris extrusa TaxID=172846 RepID=A0AAV4NUD0_CAEEX|nr:hypothetical protein CEXT_195261 [Caerostris extrusa]
MNDALEKLESTLADKDQRVNTLLFALACHMAGNPEKSWWINCKCKAYECRLIENRNHLARSPNYRNLRLCMGCYTQSSLIEP